MSGLDETFADLTGSLDYPMLVVTTAHEHERAGCLIGFATQCSIDPPRFLVCLSENNRTRRLAERSAALAVHLLPRYAIALARLFGAQTGDEIDKFARCSWHDGPRGQPILDECGSWFVGTIIDRRSLGDHVEFVLDPTDARHDDHTSHLQFSHARHLNPGHPA